MCTNKQTLRLTALAAALAGAFGPALAQDDGVAQYTKPTSWFSLGAGWWSDDRPQQGIYDGMNQNGFYGLLDAYINKRDDATGTWYKLDVRNLGLDTREIRGDWLRQGNIGAFIEYSRIPRDNPYTFLTGLSGIGGTTLVQSGAGANALPINEVHLETHRDLWNFGFYKNLIEGLDVRINFKNEDKTGTRQWGRGGEPAFAVEPIDSTTRQLEAVLNYMRGPLQVSGGYYGSWYDNSNGLVTISTLGQAISASNPTYLSLPLDNQAHQFFLNGGYNFTPSTRGTFKVSYTHATQDEHLPTKDITGVSASLPGSPQNLNGELNTTLAQLGLTSRVTSDLSLLANVRYYNSDEKTPQARFVQTGALPCATGATGGGATCVDNTPLGFETWSGKLEGTYRLPMGFSLIGGIDYASQDRVVPVGVGTVSPTTGIDRQRYVPFRSDLDETTYRLQVRRGLSETINGSLAYLHSSRRGDSYVLTNETESDEINPIHIANRDRDRWRLMLDWTPLEALTFTVNYEHAQDKYDTSSSRPYALTKGTGQVFSLDATYAISDAWQVNAWYSWDQTEAEQFAQRAATGTAGPAEKEANLEDTGNTFGLGLRGLVTPKLRIGVDALYAKQNSKYPETITLTGAGTLFPAGVLGPLPDIENKLTRFKLFAAYAVQKNAEVRLDYIWEQWKTDDWSWQFANGSPFVYTGTGTTPGTFTDGTQVIQNPKQTSNFIGVRYIYKFQ